MIQRVLCNDRFLFEREIERIVIRNLNRFRRGKSRLAISFEAVTYASCTNTRRGRILDRDRRDGVSRVVHRSKGSDTIIERMFAAR